MSDQPPISELILRLAGTLLSWLIVALLLVVGLSAAIASIGLLTRAFTFTFGAG